MLPIKFLCWFDEMMMNPIIKVMGTHDNKKVLGCNLVALLMAFYDNVYNCTRGMMVTFYTDFINNL